MAILHKFRSWKLLLPLAALSLLDLCSSLDEDVFVLEDKKHPEKKTIVIVTRTDEEPVDCVTLSNRMLVEEIISSPAEYTLLNLSGKALRNVVEECSTLSKQRKRRETKENDNNTKDDEDDDDCNDSDDEDECEDQEEQSTEDAENMWNIIFPGTKWCGNGDIAKNNSDLGILKDTDMCCRSHDLCNDTIPAGETRHNLTNDSRFTSLSCECDEAFYECLSNVNSVYSNTIGRTYFNILRRRCFTKDYPLTETCKTYRSFLKISCKEYERNTTVPKVYLWKTPKRYRKLPLPIVG